MDVGIVEGGGCEKDEGEECHENEWVDAVHPTTRCDFCQGMVTWPVRVPRRAKVREG